MYLGAIPVLFPKAIRVDSLRNATDPHWQSLTIRATERGQLNANFASQQVWSVRQDDKAVFHGRQETPVMRRDHDGKCYYVPSNANPSTPLHILAQRKCQRFFIERANQDAKSEFGWDEIQTTKY